MLSPALAKFIKRVEQLPEEQQDQVAEYLRRLVDEIAKTQLTLQYGNERIRDVASQRGINWDELNEHQRDSLINDILHEE